MDKPNTTYQAKYYETSFIELSIDTMWYSSLNYLPMSSIKPTWYICLESIMSISMTGEIHASNLLFFDIQSIMYIVQNDTLNI